ncbi:uncharacterized protein At1g01500-like [Primulina eburnea]|uniref:uncharacterized protein At1g01500-like n=1 Tax=Primulina eburnea TaxID=1245227 RepID=UPI003C6BE077
MDFNEEEEMLFSLREMEDSDEEHHENGVVENGNTITKHPSHQQSNIKASLAWLDVRVFYVGFSKCVIQDDSTPECLTLNYVPLNRDILLEINGIRTSIYADGVSSLLKRDRLDKRSEEVTFVSTDSIRMAGSVKFEVFCKDVLVLSGILEFCPSNGLIVDSKNHWQGWSMNCESDVHVGAGFLEGNQNRHTSLDSISPAIEVYVAGCYSSSPIILTKTLQIGHGKKQKRTGKLDSIPEYEEILSKKDNSSISFGIQSRNCLEYKLEEEGNCSPCSGMVYFEGEDGELSWFNAGLRVGVGIGLSVCLGVGIGVGLLARTYQGTARNFVRRLM